MSQERKLSSAFQAVHTEVLAGHRVRYNDVWRTLKKGVENSRSVSVETNAVGFAYHAAESVFSVYLTYSDGSDETYLKQDDFCRELAQVTVGGPKC